MTDENGKFRMTGPLGGLHSMTVTSAGVIVGYVEFNISTTATSVVDLHANDDGTYLVHINQSMKYLEFNFGVLGEGEIDFTSAYSIAKDKLSDFPNTGDPTQTVVMFVFVSSLLMILILAMKRKKQIKE
jgi:hypothetical protein